MELQWNRWRTTICHPFDTSQWSVETLPLGRKIRNAPWIHSNLFLLLLLLGTRQTMNSSSSAINGAFGGPLVCPISSSDYPREFTTIWRYKTITLEWVSNGLTSDWKEYKRRRGEIVDLQNLPSMAELNRFFFRFQRKPNWTGRTRI